jgi:hypothetical protein
MSQWLNEDLFKITVAVVGLLVPLLLIYFVLLD